MIELLISYRMYYSDIIRSMINWILIYTVYTNMITITDIPLFIPVLSHVLGPLWTPCVSRDPPNLGPEHASDAHELVPVAGLTSRQWGRNKLLSGWKS